MNQFRSLAVLALVLVAGSLFAVQTSTQPLAQPTLQTPLAENKQPAPGQSALTIEALPTLSETVGLLSGLQLYQTYLNIGMLADARAEGLYEASELAQLLGSVVVPLDTVDKQLAKVAALKGLSKEDATAITRMRKIAGRLKQQGKSLQAFWDTGVEDHGKKYEESRQAAWKELDELLELSPKVGVAPEPKPAEKTQ
ncbi:MAG: hypothetical protein C0467_29375 [Planctomycetaceae bacterium]|nr:hypothetical protein [Planctomycetaceae bacterium]